MSNTGATAADSTTVHVHLSFTMRGTVPLRLVDLLFQSAHLLVVEYDYFTPLDLTMGAPSRRAAAFADHINTEGLAAALDSAETVTKLAYDELETVRVYDGGWIGRETVAIEPLTGTTQIVRVHGSVDLDQFIDAVRSVLSSYAVDVERRNGLAFEFNGMLGRLSRR